jgi:thiazole synthase
MFVLGDLASVPDVFRKWMAPCGFHRGHVVVKSTSSPAEEQMSTQLTKGAAWATHDSVVLERRTDHQRALVGDDITAPGKDFPGNDVAVTLGANGNGTPRTSVRARWFPPGRQGIHGRSSPHSVACSAPGISMLALQGADVPDSRSGVKQITRMFDRSLSHPAGVPADPDRDSRESWLVIGDRALRSRLILGIEQYASAELVARVLEAGAADVFITTFDTTNTKPSLLLSDLDDAMNLDRLVWIGTTSFARSKDEALRTARMLRKSFGIDIVKLDVRPSNNLPHNGQTVKAAHELIKDGFAVLPFILPDPETARALEEIGCSAIRAMASPVASYRGIDDESMIRKVIEAVTLPVIVEGGIGSPAHVALAMQLGAAGVLVNTAVARASDPVRMAASMRHAVLAGHAVVDQRRATPV